MLSDTTKASLLSSIDIKRDQLLFHTPSPQRTSPPIHLQVRIQQGRRRPEGQKLLSQACPSPRYYSHLALLSLSPDLRNFTELTCTRFPHILAWKNILTHSLRSKNWARTPQAILSNNDEHFEHEIATKSAILLYSHIDIITVMNKNLSALHAKQYFLD